MNNNVNQSVYNESLIKNLIEPIKFRGEPLSPRPSNNLHSNLQELLTLSDNATGDNEQLVHFENKKKALTTNLKYLMNSENKNIIIRINEIITSIMAEANYNAHQLQWMRNTIRHILNLETTRISVDSIHGTSYDENVNKTSLDGITTNVSDLVQTIHTENDKPTLDSKWKLVKEEYK